MDNFMISITIGLALTAIPFIITGVIIIIFLIRSEKTYKDIKNKDIELQRKQLFINSINPKAIEEVQTSLNMLIEECFQDYIANNPEYLNSDYISEEFEIKMMTELGNRISTRMSEALYTKLTLYYNKAIITDIIAEKLYLKVTQFIVSKNVSE